MDRREFLRNTGAAAAAATTATAAATQADASDDKTAAPYVAKGLQELRLAMPWPDAACGLADQAHRLAQRITVMSEGRFRIAFVPGVTNGLAALRAGDADLYHGSEHDHLDAHRALAYFAGLPGDRAVTPHHLAAWILVGGGQTLWDDLAGNFGVKAMLAGHSGDEPCFLATQPIEDMGVLTGQRVSVQGLARDVVRGFGMEPADVGAADLPAALSGGEVLAAEWGGAITSHSLGLTAAAPHAVGTSINKHGSALSLGMRRTLWDSLTAADQAIFTTVAAAEYQVALAEEEAHRRLIQSAALPKSTWPWAHDFERAIRRVADAVVAHVAASDFDAQRINAGFMGFRSMLSNSRHTTASA